MGANRRKPYPDVARERIKASLLLEKLENHVLGSTEMTASQVNAAKILLGKVIPDMKAIEHSGGIDNGRDRMTDDELNAAIAAKLDAMRNA
jgi:hypothetical protein